MVRQNGNLRQIACGLAALLALTAGGAGAQTKPQAAAAAPSARPRAAVVRQAAARPKLVVLLVVDQMRGDYVEKFQGQWTGGLKRLVKEGAWFRAAAYPYAATETCVGHATISTGAFPAMHGMVANEWWDRDGAQEVTCTADPRAKNTGYAGIAVKGGDSGWRLAVPSFAEELRFQSGGATRVVTFSLKARAAIDLAGHRGDAVTWFDGGAGAWTTSNVYGAAPFVEKYAEAHPVKEDYGKTWAALLPAAAYLYDEKATGAVPPQGWGAALPHALRGKDGGAEPDRAFYQQWQTSPFSDAYLGRLAEQAVDALGLGQRGGTDFLGVSFSALDYAGHAFGPRSHEVQDVLARLDGTLGALFTHLDKKVGRGNYVVALSADHGVVPIPEDMAWTGADAGWLKVAEVAPHIEKALEPFHYPKPVLASAGSEIYFAPGVYERLKSDPAALQAVLQALEQIPGVARVYRAEELQDRPASASPVRNALAASYFAGRSGDLFLVPKPYWAMDYTAAGAARRYGTVHGTPYLYDQRVPILLMGFGIRPGEYWKGATPADIAPTLAALCGITLAPRDGHMLADALQSAATEKPAPH
ncbi:MAG: alkaline phosphatase family protein [Acidobacteriia bacterium]|nr:alkaline phosphatase family protein [Terriglobia bacterium]